ncbi:MAG: hypothetical protein KDD61_06025 [Bdellovibrionales bacterium]|nr:hypothetical protein [Bdellovibrionales bacterium]
MRQNIFTLTQDFLKSKQSCNHALKHLKKGTEIAILLEGRMPCALFFEENSVKFEKRPARSPDLTFFVYPEAVRRLSQLEGDNMTELGIEITREMALGTIELKVNGPISHLLTKGYYKILIEAGPDFLNYLKDMGVESWGRISELMHAENKDK